MPVSATDAKNRFGYFCSRAKTEPVIVEKDGRPDTVLVSYDEYQALKAASDPRSFDQRRREFNEKHQAWIEEQNKIVEEFGVFGEEYRVW